MIVYEAQQRKPPTTDDDYARAQVQVFAKHRPEESMAKKGGRISLYIQKGSCRNLVVQKLGHQVHKKTRAHMRF